MSNNISDNNVLAILKSYFNNRFLDLSPTNFEYLIAKLFEQKFESAKVTKKSGDFGADVIAYNGEEKIVIEVKRFNKKNKVGNQSVNNLIAAKNYYRADKCIFITTSDFTKAAKIIADSSNIELWNWNKLTQEISKYFWGGKSYYEYYSKNGESNSRKKSTSGVQVQINRVEFAQTEKRTDLANWFYLDITNTSEEILNVSVQLPKIINKETRQFDVDGYQTGYFTSGEIYPGATVTSSFYLFEKKAGRVTEGDKIYLGLIKKNTKENYYLDIEESAFTSLQNDNQNDEQDDMIIFIFIMSVILILSVLILFL